MGVTKIRKIYIPFLVRYFNDNSFEVEVKLWDIRHHNDDKTAEKLFQLIQDQDECSTECYNFDPSSDKMVANVSKVCNL